MCPSKVVTWRREWGFRVSFRVAILTASHVCPELHHSSPIVCEDVCSDCQNCRIINVWLKALLLCVLTWICYLLSMRIEGIGDVAPVLFACLLYVANMTPGSCVYVVELGIFWDQTLFGSFIFHWSNKDACPYLYKVESSGCCTF
jgi:hypothetical protein